MANLSWISSNPDYINQMIRNTQVTLSNNYNDLDNIPIIKITSTTNNPQKIWVLKEGLYMIDGVAQVDNSTSYEVSNLLISMTARLENGKYILSAFIPYLRGLFEYILKTNSTEYEQHQKIVLMIKNDTLALDNETIYTPIEDYHPATKKYVDDKTNEIVTELDRMGVNKENLESLNKENRIRDIKLQALLSETSDRNITIEENVRYFDMPLSIDNGIVTINEIIGETLVNVCDQEESVAITKSYTVENENHIALQGEYDGSCRPVVHGNTLVNHNADWDGKVQTGIVTNASGIEDVQVEGIKGQEVSVVVEGNTVLNHALGKTSAVVDSIEDNLLDSYFSGYNVKFPQLNEIATLDGTNNDAYTPTGRIKILQNNTDLVYGEVYTIIVDVLSLPENTRLHWYIMFTDDTYQYSGTTNAASAIGKYIKNVTISEVNKEKTFKRFALYIPSLDEGVATIQNPILLKGDHTTNPKYVNSNEGNYVDLTVANDMSSVVEIEGRTMYYNNDTGEYLYEFVENSNLSLKSSYECEATEDGKYKVDVKVTGKNLFDGVLPERIDTWSLSCYIRKGTYRFSANLSGFNNGTRLVIAFTDKDDEVITNTRIGYNTILDRDCYKMYFYSNDYSYNQSVNNFVNISNFQIEEGTVATSYEPYFESTKTFYLNSPLLEGDKIVTKNGKVYHYHKMGKVVLNGSRTWWGSSNINGITFMATTSLFNLGTSDRKMLCDSLRVNQGINQDTFTGYNEILAHKSSAYSNACYISTQLSQSDFINWLKSNPITVVYELDTPYYELIDEYNNTILNIPKNVAHLTHTSAVPVNNTVFTNYKDELNVLEANTQYRVMFDCDTANIPFTITLGGTSQQVTSKIGTHSLLITTPTELVDKNLVIDGIGRCGIDNIRIFKGDVEYDYVKGLWSGYEERKLENLTKIWSKLSWELNIYNTNGQCKLPNGGFSIDYSTDVTVARSIDDKELLKHGKVYTFVCKITKNTLERKIEMYPMIWYYGKILKGSCWIQPKELGTHVCCVQCNNDYSFKFAYQSANLVQNGILSFEGLMVLEGDWTDNPPTYEEVMANEGKYAVKVKLDTNATIFGKGGRL